MTNPKPYLVLGGRGKTGRRVADRLAARELPVRLGSRSGTPPFDWTDRTTWPGVLDGVGAAYVTYQPDLAVPGAADALGSFIDQALDAGVRRLVLMSGRGEEEAEGCERILQASGADWTVIRSSWLDQNFSESFMLDMVLAGEVALPVRDVGEPFVDAEDIADIAVAALTDERHIGELYEVTGPRLLSFGDAVAEIGRATGREVRMIPLSREEFAHGLAAEGVSGDEAWLLDYLFATVLDGRNERLADGVQRALGREPRDFRDYAQRTAASGVWRGAAGRAA
jgi:uncharacterized protein YbjT (DUF2867 family)